MKPAHRMRRREAASHVRHALRFQRHADQSGKQRECQKATHPRGPFFFLILLDACFWPDVRRIFSRRKASGSMHRQHDHLARGMRMAEADNIRGNQNDHFRCGHIGILVCRGL